MSLTRCITEKIALGLARGKSILLLGPRQTGKTTLIKTLAHDRYLNLMDHELRRHYEQSPSSLLGEVKALATSLGRQPCVIVDEVQRCPELMDSLQLLIDEQVAQFIITGSSARKLRRQTEVNLLPGRVIPLTLAPLIPSELPPDISLVEQLNYGTLPGIVLLNNNEDKNTDLMGYANIYLEEEVRAEALVRDLGHFSRFLQLSAAESGTITNFSRLSEDVGVSHITVKEYYQILEDCLIAIRVDPFIAGTRRRLIKSPRYFYFDLGVRRACAKESAPVAEKQLGNLFEHWVTLTTWRWKQYFSPLQTLYFWR
ncbi:MAG TPA: AAA family ATPase, partial [Gammaproteobacteria bacterium]|nr:AAA family ATPase [Gammaproteobacteria bacterium]